MVLNSSHHTLTCSSTLFVTFCNSIELIGFATDFSCTIVHKCLNFYAQNSSGCSLLVNGIFQFENVLDNMHIKNLAHFGVEPLTSNMDCLCDTNTASRTL